MHRFFVPPDRIRHRFVEFDADQAHQMRRVLRLRPGDRVTALEGTGRQYEVTLEEVGNARATGRAADPLAATGEPAARLTLYQSLLRREKFEWVLQKGTEIGVAAFVPVITRRSLVRDAEDVGPEKLDRWRRIIREAAEQSGRGLLPALSPPIAFAAAIEGARAADVALIAWEGETRHTIGETLGARAAVAEIALFIGDESFTGNPAALPREVREVVSREVSIHVGGTGRPEIREVISREISLLITNGPPAGQGLAGDEFRHLREPAPRHD